MHFSHKPFLSITMKHFLGIFCCLLFLLSAPPLHAGGLYTTSSSRYSSSLSIVGSTSFSPVTGSVTGSNHSATYYGSTLQTGGTVVYSGGSYEQSSGYHSRIYAPFSNEQPSTRRLGGIRDDDDEDDGPSTGGNAGDPGQQSNEFPIGTEWVLIILLFTYIGLKHIKHNKTISEEDML